MANSVELLTCPACQIAMTRTVVDNREQDRCILCGGVWLDRFELETALSNVEALGAPASSIDLPWTCECPRCKHPLVSGKYGYDSNVSIQKCESCHGTWLHHTQLSEIARSQSRVRQPSVGELLLMQTFRSDNRWQQAGSFLKSPLWACGAAVCLGVLCMLVARHPAPATIFFSARAVLPLLCIWQCDWLGEFTGIGFRLAGPRITEKTPPLAVAAGAWFLLLASFAAALLRF